MKPFISLFLSCLIITVFISHTNAFELNISVGTDMPFYSPGQLVHVSVNFTKNGQTNETSLVGLEVTPPSENPSKKIFRGLKVGSGSVIEGPMLILEAFSSDAEGNPRNVFTRTGYTFFNCYVHIVNWSNEIVDFVYVTVNIFDQNLCLLGTRIEVYTDQYPSDEVEIVAQILIPEWAALGSATMFVNLFSNFPSSDGHPYCREKTEMFEITDPFSGSGMFASAQETQATPMTENGNGTYNMTFRLPSANCELGNYTIYVCARFDEQQVMNNVTFEVKTSGDINGDGKVDWKDLRIFALAYGSSEGEPAYVAEADFNSDGTINWKDLRVLALNYGRII